MMQMNKQKWQAVGVGSAAALGYAWYEVRLYMRDAVVEKFNTEYKYDRVTKAVKTAAAAFGKDVRIPTARDFANSMVPLLGFNTPYTAIDDILEKGRKSRYWPAKFKKGGVSAAMEPYLLAAMKGAYNTPDDATNAQMAVAAGQSLLTTLTGKK
jgi:hypothetical protein